MIELGILAGNDFTKPFMTKHHGGKTRLLKKLKLPERGHVLFHLATKVRRFEEVEGIPQFREEVSGGEGVDA